MHFFFVSFKKLKNKYSFLFFASFKKFKKHGSDFLKLKNLKKHEYNFCKLKTAQKHEFGHIVLCGQENLRKGPPPKSFDSP